MKQMKSNACASYCELQIRAIHSIHKKQSVFVLTLRMTIVEKTLQLMHRIAKGQYCSGLITKQFFKYRNHIEKN